MNVKHITSNNSQLEIYAYISNGIEKDLNTTETRLIYIISLLVLLFGET